MSLQFIIGSSGVGKSHFAYEEIIQKSLNNPKKNYYVIVPEQFTMQTQKTLVEMHPGKGILNIDILSFERLAYRVFEEVGGDSLHLLEETGKSMVLRKVAQKYQKDLPYLGSQIKKPGCLNEVKSLVSEFLQYEVHEEELREMVEQSREKTLLYRKLCGGAVPGLFGVSPRTLSYRRRDHGCAGEDDSFFCASAGKRAFIGRIYGVYPYSDQGDRGAFGYL